MAIDFRIRDFLYPAGILRLRQTLERTQWLPAAELQAYQERRLAALLAHAYAHVPYYRRRWRELGLTPAKISCAADLKKLPLLTKDAVRTAGGGLLAENARRFHPVACRTSGSSGQPLPFYLDKGSQTLEFVYYWRHWSWAGFRLGDRFAELGSAFFLGREGLDQRTHLWQPHLRRLMLNSTQLSPAQARHLAEAVRRRRPRFLKGMASALYYLAVSLKEAGIRDLSFQAAFSNGEVLTPHYRHVVASVLNCRVLDSYGHMERTAAICECPRGGYHVNADYGVLELEAARPSPDGQTVFCRAVGTALYNFAMPLIRYDVGDTIETFAEPRACPCGRSLPLVKAIHGRSEDAIVTPDGRFITSMFILPEYVGGIDFVQFVQRAPERLEIRLVPGSGWDDPRQEKLLAYARKMVGPQMRIDVARVGPRDLITDPSGKRRSVISRVGRAPAAPDGGRPSPAALSQPVPGGGL